jgi:hypothetical protein
LSIEGALLRRRGAGSACATVPRRRFGTP